MSDDDAYQYCLQAAESAARRYTDPHDPLTAAIHDYWLRVAQYLHHNPPRRSMLTAALQTVTERV